MEGVFRKILSVNLTRGLTGEERLPDGWYRDSLGGLGVGIKYLLEDLALRKPLLDDPIILMTGPLTGTPLPGSSKAGVISFRRDSGRLTVATLEGRFPAHLKLAGFDGLVITGRAAEPVSLHISQAHRSIVDASPLWGKDLLSLDDLWGGNGSGGSILAIGPAGESENLCAGLVADRWVHGGAGVGRDFGFKRLKRIVVEPDSDLDRATEDQGIPAAMISYLQKHSGETHPGEVRRSCFGCVRCCGKYDSRGGLFFFEEDVEKLWTLAPDWSEDARRHFYRECLKKGLDPFGTIGPIARMGAGKDISTVLEEFIDQPPKPPGDAEACVDTRSWEEAHLLLHGEYRDGVFQDIRTIQGLVERENWAMVKNCLPVCERWEMSPGEMVLFLNQVTGSDYSGKDLLSLGETLTREIMRLYRSLGYSPVDPQGLRFCRRRFPLVLSDGIEAYLAHRGWEKTGFPGTA